MLRKGARTALMLALVAFIFGPEANGQTTKSGFSLSAAVSMDGKVELKWTKPPGDSVRYFLVYRADMPTILSFARVVDSTSGTEWTDAPPRSSVLSLYSYYVEAVMKAGSRLRSNTATVTLGLLPRWDIVRITSEPAKEAAVGSLYRYQVTAVSSDTTAHIRFELSSHPDGMKMDSSGLITWTPARKGYFFVQLAAYSSKGGKASQQYSIAVTGPQGIIAGTVTDTAGHAVPRVAVQIYARDRENHFEYSAYSDSAGRYQLRNIDFGTYIARADPPGNMYLSQWYDGVATAEKATPIDVKDSVAVSVNFKLRAKASIRVCTLSGIVADTLGKPLSGAWVTFTLSSFVYNSARPDGANWAADDDHRDMFDQGQQIVFALGVPSGMMSTGQPSMMPHSQESLDFRIDGASAFVYRTQTGADGSYSIKLPQGSYIGEASAPGYYRLFYNNKANFLSADIIQAATDTPGINFALTAFAPVAYGSIAGSVVDSVSGAGVISRIVGFRLRVAGGDALIAPRAFFVDTDSLGAYSLTNLPPGDYVLLAIPLGHYVPSYYSTSGTTRRWKDATTVQVNGSAVAGIVISVVPMLQSSTGYSSVNGSVTSTSYLSDALGKRTSAVGVDGSLVYAVDNSSGQVAGYGVTNTDGSFTVGNLAPGSYTITVDKVDYSSVSSTANPTYDPATGNAVSSTVSLSVDAAVTAVSSDPALPMTYDLQQNYPNPFNPSTQIAFTLPLNARVTLTVYTLLGQKVSTLVDGVLAPGLHRVTWDGRDGGGRQLSSGVYFYMLKTSGFTAARKMVLLK